MAFLKCKMCGGELDISENSSICVCQYCGSKQTIPNVDDEKKCMLFNRANALRLSNDFDGASMQYQAIVSLYPKEAEAYWGLVLSKYGIEYVDDPISHLRKPTIHRLNYQSILEDINYLEALKLADSVSREQYEREAKTIFNIQQNILEISKADGRYDIFICYKETDEFGKRTVDSTIGEEIYETLTQKGYKVFFSRISLESKIGQLYEPYIFSALQSSKVMLVIGTKIDYFNAVWVKNEWKRFLGLMCNDCDKYLIPCYKNIDPYLMPQEFLPLQSQDLSKIGYIKDLTRGIEKLIGKDFELENPKNATVYSGDYLMVKAKDSLKDSDFVKAKKIIEMYITLYGENDETDIINLLIEVKKSSLDELMLSTVIIEKSVFYLKLIKSQDTSIANKFKEINTKIYENIDSLRKENEYKKAYNFFEKNDYERAFQIFKDLKKYRDSESKLSECVELLNCRALNILKEDKPNVAKTIFILIAPYIDVSRYIEECERQIKNKEKNEIYSRCQIHYSSLSENMIPVLQACCKDLKTLGDYKDSVELIKKYELLIARIENLSNKQKQHQKSKDRKAEIIISVSVVLLVCAIVAIFVVKSFC